MEKLREWLFGVTACALFVSFIRELLPQNAAGGAARFAGGLILLLALLRPLGPLATENFEFDIAEYREKLEKTTEKLKTESSVSLSDSIAARAEEYIEANAARFNLVVRAEVQVEPESFAIERIILTGEESEEFSHWIEDTFAADKEQVIWNQVG